MKDIIITKDAGKELPADVQAHLAARTGTFGYAILCDGKITLAQNLEPSQLPEYKDILKEFSTVYYFGTDTGQPCILLKNEKDSPLLVAFLEGDYEDYHDTNGQTDTANFVKDYLQTKIDDMVDMFDGDVAKVSKAIKKPSSADDIIAKCGKRAVLTFFDISEDIYSLQTEDSGRLEFDWGAASHALTDVPVADAATPIKKEEMTTAEKLAAMRAKTATKSATPGVHKTEASVTKLNTPLQTDIKNADALSNTTAIRADTQEMVYPPEGALRSNSTAKEWYNAHFGTCPQGYKLGVGDPKKAVGMPRSLLKESSNLRHTTGTTTVGTAGASTIKAEVVEAMLNWEWRDKYKSRWRR